MVAESLSGRFRVAYVDTVEAFGFSTEVVERTPGFLAQLQVISRTCSGWDGRDPMLVHCWAGVSRSTAAAYVVACQARPLLSERELALRLRELSPTATPNLLIVRHADKLLGRDGRMVDAVAAIGRGAEAMLGTAFTLEL